MKHDGKNNRSELNAEKAEESMCKMLHSDPILS